MMHWSHERTRDAFRNGALGTGGCPGDRAECGCTVLNGVEGAGQVGGYKLLKLPWCRTRYYSPETRNKVPKTKRIH